MKRIIVAVSGASGVFLARALLSCLDSDEVRAAGGVETHLIISVAARQVMEHEGTSGGATPADLTRLAHTVHDPANFAAPMASGSWRHDGMVICPCSMATLAAVASGCGSNLIHRAADVSLKERRPLVLVTRETPLSRVHIANMSTASLAGATIMPPCPAYYAGPNGLEDAARHFAVRVLDQLGIAAPPIARWGE